MPPSSTPTEPALIIVAATDDRTRAVVGDELTSRYGGDYEVAVFDDVPAALTRMRRAADTERRVAMVLVAYQPDDRTGIDFLAEVRDHHPTAARGILVVWGDFASAADVFEAVGNGYADFSIIRPEFPRDEEFHATITESLSDWQATEGGGHEAVRIIGDRASSRSHELRDTFSRNHIPIGFYDVNEPGVAEMLADLGIPDADLPVVCLLFTRDPTILQNPTDLEIAEAFGLMTPPPADKVFDLVVIGSGPAGLAAAVYGASEGLSTMVVEQLAVGGQAGTSSLIRNYPGFPRGISGAKLAFRTFLQAWTFGAEFTFMRIAGAIEVDGDVRTVRFTDGTAVRALAVVVATGVAYRMLDIPELDDLMGRGVFYGAAVTEAPAMAGRHVYVVGGGNSAGQAAMHLAKYARDVTVLIRGETLAVSMSEYLIRELDAAPNVTVRYHAEVAGGGAVLGSLDHIDVRDRVTGESETVPCGGLFVLIGSQPQTDWLEGIVLRDGWGFLITGSDLMDAMPQRMYEDRPPLPFETSTPGVFAAGDVRRGSVKRVATAVGGGAITIAQVHAYLESLHDGSRR